eukprot:7399075-Karenia_brevis.AAC.1
MVRLPKISEDPITAFSISAAKVSISKARTFVGGTCRTCWLWEKRADFSLAAFAPLERTMLGSLCNYGGRCCSNGRLHVAPSAGVPPMWPVTSITVKGCKEFK